MTDAPYRATLGMVQKLRFAPAKQRHQLGTGQAATRVEVGQAAAPGKFVPRANQLAVVAAIDAVADQGAQFQRDRTWVFNGEVRNATARIEPVGRNNGLGWADVDAGRTAAAMRVHGTAGRQHQVEVDLAQEKQGAGFAVQHQRVFAAPPQATAHGQLGLEHRGRVGKHAVAQASHCALDTQAQGLQPLAQHFVVVPSARVERHRALQRSAQAREFDTLPALGGGCRQVIHARREHA